MGGTCGSTIGRQRRPTPLNLTLVGDDGSNGGDMSMEYEQIGYMRFGAGRGRGRGQNPFSWDTAESPVSLFDLHWSLSC